MIHANSGNNIVLYSQKYQFCYCTCASSSYLLKSGSTTYRYMYAAYTKLVRVIFVVLCSTTVVLTHADTLHAPYCTILLHTCINTKTHPWSALAWVCNSLCKLLYCYRELSSCVILFIRMNTRPNGTSLYVISSALIGK